MVHNVDLFPVRCSLRLNILKLFGDHLNKLLVTDLTYLELFLNYVALPALYLSFRMSHLVTEFIGLLMTVVVSYIFVITLDGGCVL